MYSALIHSTLIHSHLNKDCHSFLTEQSYSCFNNNDHFYKKSWIRSGNSCWRYFFYCLHSLCWFVVLFLPNPTHYLFSLDVHLEQASVHEGRPIPLPLQHIISILKFEASFLQWQMMAIIMFRSSRSLRRWKRQVEMS